VIIEEMEVGRDEGPDLFAKEATAGHPLVVIATAVVVRTVEPGFGKNRLQPQKELLVALVHSQRDLRLSAITAKMGFADEQAKQESLTERVDLWASGLGRPHPPSLLAVEAKPV